MKSGSDVVTRAKDVAERLMKACNGHPAAEIPWPHRLLHDAEGIIRELLAASPELLPTQLPKEK